MRFRRNGTLKPLRVGGVLGYISQDLAGGTRFWRFWENICLIPKQLYVWQPGCNCPDGMLNAIAGRLENYMDLLSARQKLVATNIANADTPGYETQDLDFQSELLNATGGKGRAVNVPGLQVKNDGNNVNLDREARLLSENALRFQMASQLMKSQIRIVRSAVTEGK